MVIVAVGVNLVAGVHVEDGVETLGGAGVIFKLLHLTERRTQAEVGEIRRVKMVQREIKAEISFVAFDFDTVTTLKR